MVALLLAWMRRHARPLPWRDAPAGQRDGYRVLVSEFMLQQTQVSRVIEKYTAFMKRFPTIHRLASAKEREVMAEWSGLGYYRRAKLLHLAAKEIVSQHGGIVPRDDAALRAIPGIGPYTAGAVASIAHNHAAAAVDGNVTRVLLRVHGREGRLGESTTIRWARERASEFVTATDRPGALNEALMELGAKVCTPVSPRCDDCPWRDHCLARRQGTQRTIPGSSRATNRRVIRCDCVVIRDVRGRILLEQRPKKGLWASMWQAPTLEREEEDERPETDESVALSHERITAYVNGRAGVPDDARVVSRGGFTHETTHRRVRFTVWGMTIKRTGSTGRWVQPRDLNKYGMSNAQKRAIGIVLKEQ